MNDKLAEEEKEINKKVLPDPKTVKLEANIDFEVINPTAIRRGKVRELMRMGYGSRDIEKILKNGIELPDGRSIDTSVAHSTVLYDMDYVRQELLAGQDKNILEKRAEIIDKLDFLYQRSVNEYANPKNNGQTKNSFLNTALAVMGKMVDIEGVKSPDNLRHNLSSDGKMLDTAKQLTVLGEDERQAILSTIREIITKRKSGGSRNLSLPDGTSRVRASTSDDGGVPGES
jgi:hypothetical protein